MHRIDQDEPFFDLALAQALLNLLGDIDKSTPRRNMKP
jgi:hypothetical protein